MKVVMKTRPKLDEAVILGVADAIEREPELFKQTQPPKRDCNSACCVAGWAPYVKGGVKLYNKYYAKVDYEADNFRAVPAIRDCFGLSYNEAQNLYFSRFQGDFRDKFLMVRENDCGNYEGMAKVVAAMLRDLVKRNRAGERLGLGE